VFYFMDESDRQDDDPTQQEILERCTQIRKENRERGLKLRPETTEQGVAKLLTDVYSLPITYLRFYDW
jgi:pentose-5-phosphate-3-epimerase